jgi:hypothetical protein
LPPVRRVWDKFRCRRCYEYERGFPNVKFYLLVRVRGGILSAENDIRLGNVLVCHLANTHTDVTQYGLGKAINGDFRGEDRCNGPRVS